MGSSYTDDLIRRLKLSIAGFDRGEHISTWVTWKLNQECVAELERLKGGIMPMTEREAEIIFEIEAGTLSRDQLYELAKRQALRIAELEITLAAALKSVRDLIDENEVK